LTKFTVCTCRCNWGISLGGHSCESVFRPCSLQYEWYNNY